MGTFDKVFSVVIVLFLCLMVAFFGLWAYENIILWVLENNEWWKILIAFFFVFFAMVIFQNWKDRVVN